MTWELLRAIAALLLAGIAIGVRIGWRLAERDFRRNIHVMLTKVDDAP